MEVNGSASLYQAFVAHPEDFIFEFGSIVGEYFRAATKYGVDVLHVGSCNICCFLRFYWYAPSESCKHANSS